MCAALALGPALHGAGRKACSTHTIPMNDLLKRMRAALAKREEDDSWNTRIRQQQERCRAEEDALQQLYVARDDVARAAYDVATVAAKTKSDLAACMETVIHGTEFRGIGYCVMKPTDKKPTYWVDIERSDPCEHYDDVDGGGCTTTTFFATTRTADYQKTKAHLLRLGDAAKCAAAGMGVGLSCTYQSDYNKVTCKATLA